ncbi:hypothetical protein MTP99_009877 [Tenebrio molitor]|nr:hypothetical protein MTP99_009877 [Tenebrio molitor]
MSEFECFTTQDCDAAARKCLNTDNVETVGFTVVRLPDENFLVKITVNHDCEEKTLNFFAKCTPNEPKINRILFDDFKKTIPRFDPKITPRLFYGRSDFLLFEDLTLQGFKNYNTESGFFSLEHVRVVLGVLAKFHAGSFAYEEIKTKQLGQIYRLDQEHKVIHSIVDVKKNEVTDLISSLLEDKNEDDLFKVVADLNERQLSKKFRRTLCHGNLIRENIMFKCDQKVPSESRLINFRSKQYSPPMCDVLQVIFLNTNEDFRQHYFHSLLAHYHECLKDELEKYCLDIDHILSVEDLQLGVHNFLPLVKIQAALHQQNCQKSMALRELKEILNCPLLSKEDCFTIIQNKFQTTNYEFLSFNVTPLDEVNGFLGNYHKLQIKIRRQKEEIINCFIKCMPKGTASKEVVQDGSSFMKESFLYETLVQKFCEEGIDTIDECLPACYFQRQEDLMVFEDMSLLNYRSLSALKPFDLEMLSMIVRKLAKFHGSAFVYEERVSERLARPYRLNEEYGRYFKESIILESDTHSGAILMATGVKGVFDATSLYPELQTKTNEENLKKHRSKLTELFYSVITASDRFRNILTHGDLWSSNILVQLDGDKPLDCRFIDFQLLRYCPPSHDLLSLLHLTTDRTTRLQHEETIKHIYYDELSQVLKFHNCDISKIYPYDEFVGAIDYMRPEMVLQAAIYCIFSMCTPEEIAALLTDEETCNRIFFEDRMDLITRMCQKSHIYKTRLGERILDVYEYCNSMS